MKRKGQEKENYSLKFSSPAGTQKLSRKLLLLLFIYKILYVFNKILLVLGGMWYCDNSR